jgi:hypothetical protein
MPDPTHASEVLPRGPLPPAADEGQGRGDRALALAAADFGERMERAARDLDYIADTCVVVDGLGTYHRARIRGKAQGMRLAISYWNDALRFARDIGDAGAHGVPTTEAGQAPSPSTEESGRNDAVSREPDV